NFGDEADRYAQVRSEAAGEADDDEPSEAWSELQEEGGQWGAYLNIEGPKTIRVIRPPATTGIALVLRDCVTLDCAIPNDLRLLLDRLDSEGQCPNHEMRAYDRKLLKRGSNE